MAPTKNNRSLRLLGAALFTVLVSAAAHAHDPTQQSAPVTSPGAASGTITGTAQEVVIDNRVSKTVTRFHSLRLDDGTTLALTGAGADTVASGARVEVTGRFDGEAFEVTSSSNLGVVKGAAKGGQSTPVSMQAQGTLVVFHGDYFAEGRADFHYGVHDGGARMTPMNAAVGRGALVPGMAVTAQGTTVDGVTLDASQITILGLPPARTALGGVTPTTNNVLVMPIKFSDSPAGDPFTPAQIDQVMRTNATSVEAYYNEVSYGQQLLNITVACATSMPAGCAAHTAPGGWLKAGAATPASCDFTTMGTLADQAATAAGYVLSNYVNRFYVLPSIPACGWAGLAYIGFPYQAWSNGYNALWVYGHELGHNFSLYHAGGLNCAPQELGGTNCSVSEYGDRFDVMGNNTGIGQQMHFDAAQKSFLGWIPPSSVITHTSGTATYTLSPLESPGQSTYAVTIPVTADAYRTYWIEYRQPIGFDSGIAGYPHQGAIIHVSSPFDYTCTSCGGDDTEVVDMTPATAGDWGDAALLVGQSYVDSTYGVTIMVTAATPSALTVTVTAPTLNPTTTTTISSINPSTVGASVTFTASVTGLSPTGTVDFANGGATIPGCSLVALVGSGNTRTAACTTATLTAGVHSIVASYSGDPVNAASSSAPLSQTVKAVGTTSIATSGTPSTLGSSVTFTATVSGNAPTGSVNFLDGAASIGGCSAIALSGAGNARSALCVTSALTVGTHNIKATYGGDANNLGSSSAVLSQVVNPGAGASTTTLTTSGTPSTSGSSVTFTATVSGNAPTGNVNFLDGAASIGGCSAIALSGAGNVRSALCVTSALTVGTHNIKATYGGDAKNLGSSSVALSQVVSPSGGGGSIDVALAANGGVASASSTFAMAGYSFPVTAINDGDRTGLNWGQGGGWNSSPANAFPQWVQINFNGQKTINQVIVYTVQDNFANPVDPPANMTFTLYGITAFQVQGWSGSAWVNLGAAVAGNNLVKRPVNFAAYTTDRIRVNITAALSSYARVTEVEAWTGGTASATTTTLTSSANPSASGASVTFTATVAGNAPTGTVNFTDGGTSLASCGSQTVSAGVATCKTSSLSVGTHSIVAIYSGDPGNLASTSATLSQVVNGVAQIDVALTANGGVASASSTFAMAGYSFPVTAINDGDRAGLNWGHGGGWNSATSNVFPDWVQINFNGQKTINQVIVYTLQDNFGNPVDPPANMTFTLYGITAFQVQGWSGSAWVNLGAAVAGNNLVKRPVNFAAYTTDRIRVNITAALGNYARVTEVEAWGN